MKSPHVVFAVSVPFFALVGLATLAGCGGSSGGGSKQASSAATNTPAATARAVVTLTWPTVEQTRLIPAAANSVRITITNAAGFSATQVVARPATSATFDNLPPGALLVSATAHSDNTGNALPAQASGSQTVQAVADQQFTLGLTLASTITQVIVTPATTSVGVGQTAALAASARDAANNLVLTGGTTWQWASDNGAVVGVVPVSGGSSATVSGNAPGSATVRVTETESGKSVVVSVSVTTAPTPSPTPVPSPTPTPDPFAGVKEYTNLNLNALANYANPVFPVHYDQNVRSQTNTPPDNAVTDKGATLGRVLFWDKRLSVSDTVSCASCHQQNQGLTDTARFSTGFSGSAFTTAHAMRLGNVGFYTGNAMFWDKRAASVEAQSTQPIQNSVEMGFDAAHGGFANLTTKMQTLPYYPELFQWVYGDSAITEDRVQKAIAQFERSMVSTHSKFDTGFAQVFAPGAPGQGIGAPFANFTPQENQGKNLFLQGPNQGGAGCATCHRAPTFALDPNSRSNGLDAGETVVFKSPSLKNVGVTGPYMHDGRFQTLEQVVDHYNTGVQLGPALDNRLRPGGQPQRLNLSTADRDALVAFLKTLNDDTLNTDPKFSNPFVK